MRIALIGDIHTYRLMVGPWRLLNKRMMGQMNLYLNRRFRFRRHLLPALWERVESIDPKLLLFTGDVSTCALRSEFADVAKMIEPMTVHAEIPAVMVPGNHDRYTYRSTRRKHMERELSHVVPAAWPHFRQLTKRWHLLALDAAYPQPLFAQGRVGPDQLAVAHEHVKQLSPEQSLVVMCHYPAVSLPHGIFQGPRHGLIDAPAVCGLLESARRLRGPVLYVHGHIHRPWVHQDAGDGLSHVVDVNAGAPCNATRSYPMGQGFWQIDLPEKGDALSLTHHVRGNGGVHEPAWREKRVELPAPS